VFLAQFSGVSFSPRLVEECGHCDFELAVIPCDKGDVVTYFLSLDTHFGLNSAVELVMSWSGIVIERREVRGGCTLVFEV
jgi:hypothetical protein